MIETGAEIPDQDRESKQRKVYVVASSAGEAFDAAELGYVLKWIREVGTPCLVVLPRGRICCPDAVWRL